MMLGSSRNQVLTQLRRILSELEQVRELLRMIHEELRATRAARAQTSSLVVEVDERALPHKY